MGTSVVEIARNEAMKLVIVNSSKEGWFEVAVWEIARLPSDWVGTGEDIRLELTRLIGPPHTPHVWGALMAQAVRFRLLWPTGERVPMKTKKSHARKTDVYQRRKPREK